jgi:hypothetical protein
MLRFAASGANGSQGSQGKGGAHVDVDCSKWPLVIATCPHELNLDSIGTLTRAFDECFARRERFALITDTRPLTRLPDAIWRRTLGDWLNEPVFRLRTGRYNVGSATIFTSRLTRSTMTAILWVWKPPAPQFAASNMVEAADWCCDMLTRAKVPMSPELDAWHERERERERGEANQASEANDRDRAAKPATSILRT